MLCYLYKDSYFFSRFDAEQRAAEQMAKEHGFWIPMMEVFDLGVPYLFSNAFSKASLTVSRSKPENDEAGKVGRNGNRCPPFSKTSSYCCIENVIQATTSMLELHQSVCRFLTGLFPLRR